MTTVVTAIIVALFLFFYLISSRLTWSLLIVVVSFLVFAISYLVESPFFNQIAQGSLIASLIFLVLVGSFIIYCNVANNFSDWKSR